MIPAELMQSKTTGFAALTTALSNYDVRDALVPCRELSQRLSEEMPLGCGGHGWPGAVNLQDCAQRCTTRSRKTPAVDSDEKGL
jgi:hypothetical protein